MSQLFRQRVEIIEKMIGDTLPLPPLSVGSVFYTGLSILPNSGCTVGGPRPQAAILIGRYLIVGTVFGVNVVIDFLHDLWEWLAAT